MPTLIRSACLKGYVPLARSAGLDPFEFLAEAGIHRSWINQPEVKFSIAAFRHLLERSAEASGWPDFGLRLAESRNLSGLGPLALLVREQPTVRAAVTTMAVHMRLHTESLHLQFEAAGERSILRLGTVASTRRPSNLMVELSVGALHRVISQLPPDLPLPLAAFFMHPCAAEPARYRHFFNAPVHFGAEFDGLVYASAALDRPRVVDPMLEGYARQLLNQLPTHGEASLADEVKALIHSSLSRGQTGLQHLCDLLGMHERTLRRRLHREGTSYEQILTQVREDLALRYVSTDHRTLTEIATLLGFSGGSRFAHWFQQRFGCSATRWRAEHRPRPQPVAP